MEEDEERKKERKKASCKIWLKLEQLEFNESIVCHELVAPPLADYSRYCRLICILDLPTSLYFVVWLICQVNATRYFFVVHPNESSRVESSLEELNSRSTAPRTIELIETRGIQ